MGEESRVSRNILFSETVQCLQLISLRRCASDSRGEINPGSRLHLTSILVMPADAVRMKTSVSCIDSRVSRKTPRQQRKGSSVPQKRPRQYLVLTLESDGYALEFISLAFVSCATVTVGEVFLILSEVDRRVNSCCRSFGASAKEAPGPLASLAPRTKASAGTGSAGTGPARVARYGCFSSRLEVEEDETLASQMKPT